MVGGRASFAFAGDSPRVTGEIYSNQDTPRRDCELGSLGRYISGAKKKYVRNSRGGRSERGGAGEERGGNPTHAVRAKVENELFAIIPFYHQVITQPALRR